MQTPYQPTPTIIVVDDDAALRTALTFMLESDGFKVLALESAERLLQEALPQPPTCLLIDQNLSGLTGLDAIAQLRARPLDIPVLLMTSNLRPHQRRTAERLGALIVEKPLLGDALISAISAALAH